MEKNVNAIAGYLFIITIFLLPLLVSTSQLIMFPFMKLIPFFLATFIVSALFIVHVFNEGSISFPKSWLFLAAALVPVAYVASAFLSVHPGGSFIGMATEIGTASFISALFLFMWLVSFFLRSKERMFNACAAFAAAYLLLSVFHITRFILGADFLSFGIFTNLITNTVGRFSDLGIISGAMIILALTSIEFLRPSNLARVAGYILLVVSLVMLSVTNFPIIIWGANAGNAISLFTLIGLFALTFFAYFVSSAYGEQAETPAQRVRRVPVASLIVLLVSALFTFGGSTLQDSISSRLGIAPQSEARLLWQPTALLALRTVTDPSIRPIFGYGPEQFDYKWLLDKPAEVNSTQMWNSSFDSGIGFIPSSVITVGLFGFLSWVAFLIVFLKIGVGALFAKAKDPFSHYLTVSSFLVSLYLWIAAIVYTPGIITFILTFFFTGLFMACLLRDKVIKEKKIVFDGSKGKSFILIMLLIASLLFILFWGYRLAERVVASSYAVKADMVFVNAKSDADLEASKSHLRNAATLANPDIYARILAGITFAQVNAVIQDSSSSVADRQAKFQNLYAEAVDYARVSIARNPNSFDGMMTYGNILAVGARLGVEEGYYQATKEVYQKAGGLNPKSPLIPYSLAKLEVERRNTVGAKAHIGEALQLKPDYIDAIILLGRIQINEGNESDALASFMVAQSIDPANQNIQAVIKILKEGNDSAAVSTSTTPR